MTWDEFNAAWQDARATLGRARDYTAQMARIVVNSMEMADVETLRKMKAKLDRFDARTGKWRKS